MLRAGTGRKGTLTHVTSIFFTVRFKGVEIAGAAKSVGLAPERAVPPAEPPATLSALTAAPRSQLRRVALLP